MTRGSIAKALIMMGPTKDSGSIPDVVLIMQYRNQVLLRSFFTDFEIDFEKMNHVSVPVVMVGERIYFL